MSAETFQTLYGRHLLQTEHGLITVTYVQITTDASGQKFGLITVSGADGHMRKLQWPLDSLVIRPGLRIELDPRQGPNMFVYKDEQNKTVHTLRVETTLWEDFKSVHVPELHRLATSLARAPRCSAGCRAGVGRTGSLFVAVKMLKWTQANPGKKLTTQHLLDFIAEGRVNRDRQVVQTENQLKLLMDYMVYLNADPSLQLVDRVIRFKAELGTVSPSDGLLKLQLAERTHNNDQIFQLLADPLRRLDADSEALLDQIYEFTLDQITSEPMREPVLTKYGHTYDRSVIEEIICRFGTCPMTRLPLTLDMLTPDPCFQHLNEILMQRSSLVLPTTEVGRTALEQVERIAIRDPLPWCRLLSAVMPTHRYFIREKAAGGANDFVLEYRLPGKVQKCSFRVTDAGKIQPTMYPENTFSSVDDLARWIGKGVAAHCLTQESISSFNATVGKDQFMQHLHRDTNLKNIVQHLEQRFDDGTVSRAIQRQGYVRASIQPASFPCFTYARVTVDPVSNKEQLTKLRLCIFQGVIFGVNACELKDVTDVKSCRQKIDMLPVDEPTKQKYLAELEKVQSQLDFRLRSVTLFVPSDKQITEPLALADIAELDQRKVQSVGYSLF